VFRKARANAAGREAAGRIRPKRLKRLVLWRRSAPRGAGARSDFYCIQFGAHGL